MKRLFMTLICLMCMFGAYADNNNTATSKDYVDAQIATLQEEIPAIDSNTVLTHTGTSGEIGSKKIYDENSDYASQQNALVTAGIFNSAVQNAIDSEFVCIDWLGEHVPSNCLLWKIRNKSQQQIVPNGYTQLEYIESTGTQYIQTPYGVSTLTEADNGEFDFSLDIQFTDNSQRIVFGYTSNTGFYWGTSSPNDTKYRQSYTGEYSLLNRHTISVHSTVDVNAVPAMQNKIKIIVNGQVVSTSNHSREDGLLLAGGPFKTVVDDRTSYAKIYGLTQHQRGELVFNGIPASRTINDQVQVGLYDTVSNTFFTDAAQGQFVAGPAVDSNLYLPSGE